MQGGWPGLGPRLMREEQRLLWTGSQAPAPVGWGDILPGSHRGGSGGGFDR